jgi:voltage-gated potassium channel
MWRRRFECWIVSARSAVGLGLGTGTRITRHVQLLGALVAMEVLNPLMAKATLTERLVSIGLFCLVCVTVFRALFRTARRRWIGSGLAGITIAIDLARLLASRGLQLQLDALLNVTAGIFYVFVLSVIVSQVFNTRRLQIDDVVGAFSGYILIALFWGRLYALAWMLMPTSFNINPDIGWELQNWSTLHALFDYFSFTTITSIGYGDMTTVGPVSDALVWLEVMCGQFYMAVVVATIVGMKVAEALSSAQSER